MSIFILPIEILEQILTELVSQDNFASLRFVHSYFANTIASAAIPLTRSFLQVHNLPEQLVSRYQDQIGLTGSKLREQVLLSFLKLHWDVRMCTELNSLLNEHRELFTGFPMWAKVPAEGFSNVESLIAFSAFHRELMRSIQAHEIGDLANTITSFDSSKRSLRWRSLDQRLMAFMRYQLELTHLEQLMTTVNFCAISTRFSSKILSSKICFSDNTPSDYWQNPELGSEIVAEHILWNGPLWLARVLRQKTLTKGLHHKEKPIELDERNDEQVIWMGSRAEAAKLTANGLARLLWKERTFKLGTEDETAGLDADTNRSELSNVPGVWRGSAGGL